VNTTSTVSRHLTWALAAGALVFVLPALAAAQEPVTSFGQLNTRVKVGDTVYVTDVQGREVKGRVFELHDASITLDGDGQPTFRGDDVRLVRRRTKSVGSTAVMGAILVGAVGYILPEDFEGAKTYGLILGAATGAALGAGIRAALPAGRRDVYRAPGAGPSARLSVAPIVTPRAKGVAIAVSF
jgi:hypothetical protein